MVLRFLVVGIVVLTPLFASAADVIRKTSAAIPDTGEYSGFTGTLALGSEASTCPSGSFIIGIQVFRRVPSITTPIDQMRYSCKSVLDKAISVRRTNIDVPTENNWDRYASSEPADGSVAGCSDGYYVDSVQGFKPELPGGWQMSEKASMSALRHSCRNPSVPGEVLKKTDVPVGLGPHWDGYSGTLTFNSPVARCPDKTYVVAIQGFKPVRVSSDGLNIGTGLGELRYLCRPIE